MTWLMHSHAEWETYLSNGRKKYERTLYDRGLRIQYANKFKRGGDIQIVLPWLNRYPLITIHPDDSMTIQSQATPTHWGGTYNPMSGYSTRYTFWKYAGMEIVQRQFKFRLFEDDAAITPPKIQGCRMCAQTGKVDGWCNALACWDVDSKTKSCPNHPEITLSDMDVQRGRHIIACEHGQTMGHKVKRGQQCYSCNGVGKRDYGSKRVSLLWDGSPLRVKNRKIVLQNQTDLERIVASYAGPTSTV